MKVSERLGQNMNARSAGSQAPPIRTLNMNAYGAQQNSQQNSRQTPRLQNTPKTGLGNGNAGPGWAFGAPSTGGAFGGLGSAPGLAQGRPGQLSGFAQVMGGGGAQGPIDMSDFPSLAGTSRPQQASSGWNSNVIRQPAQQNQATPQAPSQAQQPQSQAQPPATSTAPSHHSSEQVDSQRQQQPAGGDEFPPLGESGRPENGSGPDHVGSLGSALPNIPHGMIPTTFDELEATLEAQRQAQTQSQSQSQAPPPGLSTPSGQSNSKSKPWAEMSDFDKFGITGLNKMLEVAKAMQTGGDVDETVPVDIRNCVMLNMGHDLNDLGLDLESTEPLYKTFHPFPDQDYPGGPFDTRARHPIPEFTVPPAYYVNNVPPLEGRLGAFSDDTLFTIFFTHVKDVKQELAAAELTLRDWRWHKVLRQWLQKDTREANSNNSQVVDFTNGAPIGVEPIRLGPRSERGVYIFFNHNLWSRERREFVLNYDELDNRGAAVMAGLPTGGNTGVDKA